MNFENVRPLALASIGILLVVCWPSSVLSRSQQLPDDSTGGLARTEKSLGALGRLAEMPERASQDEAIRAYNRGLEELDKADRLEKKAAAAAGDKAARTTARAQKSYLQAIAEFRAALDEAPELSQALGGLGYALLKTGQHEAALEAYDRAIEIGPLYPEVIEERAEACLGLDRIEEAKDSWTRLQHVNRELADELMSAMQRWIEERRADSSGLPTEFIESFADWIGQRANPIR